MSKCKIPNTIVLNYNGKVRSINVDDMDIEEISDFLTFQLEDDNDCETVTKLASLLEITKCPVERKFIVTVEVEVTAVNDADAEGSVKDQLDELDLDYDIVDIGE